MQATKWLEKELYPTAIRFVIVSPWNIGPVFFQQTPRAPGALRCGKYPKFSWTDWRVSTKRFCAKSKRPRKKLKRKNVVFKARRWKTSSPDKNALQGINNHNIGLRRGRIKGFWEEVSSSGHRWRMKYCVMLQNTAPSWRIYWRQPTLTILQ